MAADAAVPTPTSPRWSARACPDLRLLLGHVHRQLDELPDRASCAADNTVVATHADRGSSSSAPAAIVSSRRRYYEQATSVLPRDRQEGLQNAMALDIAMGGSTNTILHILGAAAHGSRRLRHGRHRPLARRPEPAGGAVVAKVSRRGRTAPAASWPSSASSIAPASCIHRRGADRARQDDEGGAGRKWDIAAAPSAECRPSTRPGRRHPDAGRVQPCQPLAQPIPGSRRRPLRDVEHAFRARAALRPFCAATSRSTAASNLRGDDSVDPGPKAWPSVVDSRRTPRATRSRRPGRRRATWS